MPRRLRPQAMLQAAAASARVVEERHTRAAVAVEAGTTNAEPALRMRFEIVAGIMTANWEPSAKGLQFAVIFILIRLMVNIGRTSNVRFDSWAFARGMFQALLPAMCSKQCAFVSLLHEKGSYPWGNWPSGSITGFIESGFIL
jgi:hypothetical protein